MNMSEHTIHANGIDIHYWRTGGEKPVMLCSHGLTDNGRCWELFASEMADTYDLIMPDARGHGQSTAPEHGYRAEDRAADSLALLDALHIEHVVAIGHSMGGDSTAMLVAKAPERVRAAVLEDPSFRLPDDEIPPTFSDNWAADNLRAKSFPLDDLIAEGRKNSPSWDPRVFPNWAEAKHQVNPVVFNWLREPRTPWAEYVGQIRVPTLVVTGEPERGAIIAPEIAAKLQQLSPAIQIVRIANAGHCVRYDQPAKFVEAVRSFLATLPA